MVAVESSLNDFQDSLSAFKEGLPGLVEDIVQHVLSAKFSHVSNGHGTSSRRRGVQKAQTPPPSDEGLQYGPLHLAKSTLYCKGQSVILSPKENFILEAFISGKLEPEASGAMGRRDIARRLQSWNSSITNPVRAFDGGMWTLRQKLDSLFLRLGCPDIDLLPSTQQGNKRGAYALISIEDLERALSPSNGVTQTLGHGTG